jgi:hypothetical protein
LTKPNALSLCDGVRTAPWTDFPATARTEPWVDAQVAAVKQNLADALQA